MERKKSCSLTRLLCFCWNHPKVWWLPRWQWHAGHGLLVHQDPQGLVCKAALWLAGTQYCCNFIIPSYVQDSAFDFSRGSCKPISQVCWESAYLNSSLQHVSCSPNLVSITCKLVEMAFHPLIQDINEGAIDSNISPGRWLLVSGQCIRI